MVLTEKQQMLRKLFRQFAETEFTDELLDRLEETGEFDRAIHDKMARCGFLGVKIPVEYGGQGGDSLAYAMMVEEFARVSPVLSIYANTSNSLGAGPLLYCGTEEQKRNYVIPVAKGEKILVFALTEPGAGSDAGGTLTSAVQAGDEFILNGRKTFISGAPFADYAVVYAKTDPSQKGSKGISMFLVDMKLPGVSCGKPEHKMGIVGYPTSDIILEDVHVHKSDLLGPLHKGFSTAMKTWTRPSSTPKSASSSASPSPNSRPSASCWPTWPPRSRPRASWSTPPPCARMRGTRRAPSCAP